MNREKKDKTHRHSMYQLSEKNLHKIFKILYQNLLIRKHLINYVLFIIQIKVEMKKCLK